jgi:hypothetical protein
MFTEQLTGLDSGPAHHSQTLCFTSHSGAGRTARAVGTQPPLSHSSDPGGGPAEQVDGIQGPRAARAAARGCRAAPHSSPATPGLGGPRGPRPGRAVHRFARRRPCRCRPPGREDPAPKPAGERSCGTTRAHRPNRDHRPGADLPPASHRAHRAVAARTCSHALSSTSLRWTLSDSAARVDLAVTEPELTSQKRPAHARTKQRPFPNRRLCCPADRAVLRPPPTPSRPPPASRLHTGYRTALSAPFRRTLRPGRASPVPAATT